VRGDKKDFFFSAVLPSSGALEEKEDKFYLKSPHPNPLPEGEGVRPKNGCHSLNALALLVLLLSFFAACPALAADREVSVESGNLLVGRGHGGDGSAWGKANCKSCHQMVSIHRDAPAIRGIVKAKGYGTCTGCHGRNGTGLPRRCTVCHNKTSLPDKPMLTGSHRHDFSVRQALPLGDWQCTVCHAKSDMDGRFEVNVDLTPIRDRRGELSPYDSNSDFCLRCHNRDHQPPGVKIKPRPRYGINDPLTASEDDYTRIDRHGLVFGRIGPYTGLRESGYRYGDAVECTDCHAMHGTRNGKLILDDSRKGVTRLPEAFRNAPYRATVRKGNYAQLCVLCHQMEFPGTEQGSYDTGNGLSGVHAASSDCTECHTHGEPVRGGL
jgi:hypothetical protein